MKSRTNFIWKHKVFWVTVVSLIVLFIVFYILAKWSAPVSLPPEFLLARQEAASVSEKIVSLTNATNNKIKAVNISDLDGNVAAARNLLEEARNDNGAAYAQAFELSQYLQRIAESMKQVSSVKSQRLAYEAVSIELSLVSEFITYTQNLNEFLNSLSRALAMENPSDRQLVLNRLDDVNRNVNKINSLNQEFLSKISEFDRSL
ncbi:MAG: hypothetical protein UY32_C0013G0014 [Candidatus Jorgensenbacteria bacterium GW2011_GWC1_48_8]|uniref:DUF5667 domain-containing protein n=2 Tax=Candidatus Joergenseniibacteriota TaxID=1752739 RepID=A0A0G1W984_9BACT|nr:MAG: hypothetical protein UY32_C0013G0014 [Candidatus Jorgensenbacteria bacterium GW2011_GWC1_48_8]KKW15348.1 MAG: hypothetical protein UY55_C0001G0102 [Candidatus Jorgensenbacteria bacterium GW2011_GWB1_50_10]